MKIVKVLWEDAQTIGEIMSLKDIKETTLASATTIGFLVDENDERIAVSGFVFEGIKALLDGYRDTHFIPKKWIKQIIELEEKQK